MPQLVDDLESPSCRIEKWTVMLVGKKIGNSHEKDEFPKSDLPENSRIITADSMTTMDYNPDRLNVYLDETGVVTRVTYQ
ncbi:Inhibitor I78 superfamily [Golovinomyces cichoracearum]|uniref:Inhibitor I78 superfamily n=1 Tax=Golovinomyces cichoracearum TaxID=62708 RepID=A0A420J7I5_9PEZI|nr:Inhibitor I78 superfamily [Golovinomyces cichoracearum]